MSRTKLPYFFFFFFIGFSPFLGLAQGKIPLEKAISDALAKSEKLDQALWEADQASHQVALREKDRWFKIYFGGQYSYRSQTPILELPLSSSSPVLFSGPMRIEGGLKHNYDLNLSIHQPLWTGGQLSRAVELGHLEKQMVTDRQALITNEIVFGVISSSLRYQILQARRGSILTLKKRLEEHRQHLENLVGEELSRRANLVETLTKVEEIENSLLDLKPLIEEERLGFHRLTGHYPEEIELPPAEPALDLEEALAFLEKNHPLFRQLNEQLQMIDIQKKIVAGRYLPQLSAQAEVHYGKPGVNFFKREWALYFQGGITLQVPLFDWKKGNVEQAMLDSKARQVEAELREFREETRKSLASLYAQVESLQEKVEGLRRMASLAREKVQLKRELWQENLIPHLEYLTAMSEEENVHWLIEEANFQLLLTRVTINRIIAKYREGGR